MAWLVLFLLITSLMATATNLHESLTALDCNGTIRCTIDGVQRCLPTGMRCNGVTDCQDGSDEQGCTCAVGEFRCSNQSVCIIESRVCNGEDDCGDMSDENCPKNESVCGTGRWKSFFWCEDKCMHNVYKCNCSDKNVSASCDNACPLGKFRCKEGRCVNVQSLCDGADDCSDLSDEPPGCRNCTGLFRCDVDVCIPEKYRCDGKPHCVDGTDEMDCNNTTCQPWQFQCNNKVCISHALQCNGKDDCGDNSDEALNECDNLKGTERAPTNDRKNADANLTGWIVALVVISVLLLISTAAIFMVIRRKKRREMSGMSSVSSVSSAGSKPSPGPPFGKAKKKSGYAKLKRKITDAKTVQKLPGRIAKMIVKQNSCA